MAAARDDKATPRLAEEHSTPLRGLDAFMGAFCVFTLIVTTIAWWRGDMPLSAPVAVVIFLVANIIVSQVSFRASNPYSVERLRAVVGAVIAPLSYVAVDGPPHWWPGFLIMSLGGVIMLSLITQRPVWGRIVVGYYLVMMLVTAVFALDDPNWYAFSLQAGVIAMVGLTFAQIMSLLGQTLAKEHERTMELQAARDALFAEMEVAHEIQTLLLPKKPELPDNIVAGRMLPADEVGGDYYDVIQAPGKRAIFAVGDVSGHGLTSGLTMMMARASLVAALEARPENDLTDIYRVINRSIHQNLARMDIDMYMTFALLEYLGEGRFAAVGRHLPMLIFRRDSGNVEEVELQGSWLGLLDDIDREYLPQTDFQLGVGDRLFLYTDGIVEHYNAENEDDMFGFDRLKEAITESADSSPADAMEFVLNKLKAHGTVFDDDVTMMVIDHTGRTAQSTVGAA